ncbi:D-alanyl-D-alanine carboxypeptidase/D-alanyl-D-alanine endopeptidase [Streptomyces shenzhenensis]|uniref:D-alanyl-D-alanine carboxypeptidase/D-alanyl-D-alanine endopeptidase n=1 Tax=Streptomyces shenzhenensis TaxID=943815 RepID=UPI001F3D111D|nr:D-alanyl-D-alanine carboxypeptidase/D-alanyl-D-alanine-endopeptidase [Streptomyces shenzhenensis]
MVVPELRPWQSAKPRVRKIADALRPRLAHLVTATKPQVARLRGAVGPQLARATRATGPRLATLVRSPRPRFRTLRTWQYTAGAATAGLALAAGAVTAAGPWDADGQRTAERDRAAALERSGGTDHGPGADLVTADGEPSAAPSAGSVLTGLGAAASTVKSAPGKSLGISTTAVTDLLRPLLASTALGSTRTAVVVDVASGARLYGSGADTALTPASTTKIATAVAALSALGPDHRITTRVALEPGTREVVLVGGGDPTLTARKDAAGWASLRTLATETAKSLTARGIRQITLSYDTTLYSGPDLHPIGVNDNLARVSPLTADEGRTDDSAEGPVTRVSDPAADAARKFAGFLADAGIKTSSPGTSKASRRADTLATVSSPPLSSIVERMLTNSDNDIAEALARQTALASGRPASFDGGADAIDAQLTQLGLPMTGASFHDGSGLNRDDRLTANLLTALLVKAADAGRPGLRAVLTGLPVAGFTGTLTSRYTDGAAGVVRAKTGTLTGVNTLAGTVVDKDGRLLAFAFLTSDTTNPAAAQQALDKTATALAGL